MRAGSARVMAEFGLVRVPAWGTAHLSLHRRKDRNPPPFVIFEVNPARRAPASTDQLFEP